MKKTEIVKELKNNFSDEELFELADESKKRIIEEDSFLRKTSIKFYGEDGDNIMNMTVMIPLIVLEILVERFKVLKSLNN